VILTPVSTVYFPPAIGLKWTKQFNLFRFILHSAVMKFPEIQEGLKLNARSFAITKVDLVSRCFRFLSTLSLPQNGFQLDLFVKWFWNITGFFASLHPSPINPTKNDPFWRYSYRNQ
jgi:hypothetical protein